MGTAAVLAEKLGEYGAATVYAAESAEIDGFLVAPKATALAQLVPRVAGEQTIPRGWQLGRCAVGRQRRGLDWLL